MSLAPFCLWTLPNKVKQDSLRKSLNLPFSNQTSIVYVGKFSSPPLKGFNLGPFTNSANNKTKLREAIVWQALINCAIVGTKNLGNTEL